MAEDISIKVLIDPTNALAGIHKLRTAMNGVSSSATKASQGGIKKFEKSTKKLGDVNQRVAQGMKELSASIAAIQGPLGPVAGRITTLSEIIKRLGIVQAGVIVSSAVFVTSLKNIITVGAEAGVEMNTLRGILRATGKDAALSAEQVNLMAERLGEATLTNASEARKTAGLLLTFRNVNEKNLEGILGLTQDVAALGFGSMSTAARALGKALDDPQNGLDSLRRLGVMFTESQKLQIQAWAASGQEAKAYTAVLKIVQDRIGGVAEDMEQGLSFQLDSLGEAWTNLRVTVFEFLQQNTSLMDSLSAVLVGLTNFLKNTRDAVRGAKEFVIVNEKLKRIILAVGAALATTFGAVKIIALVKRIGKLKVALIGLGKAFMRPMFAAFAIGTAIAVVLEKLGRLEGVLNDIEESAGKMLDPLEPILRRVGDKFAALFKRIEKDAAAFDPFDIPFDTSMDKVERFTLGFKNQINAMTISAKDSFRELGENIAKIFGPGGKFEDDLTNAIVEMKSFRDVMNSISKQIAADITRTFISRPLSAGISGIIKDLLPGATADIIPEFSPTPAGVEVGMPLETRAKGGPVTGGKSYLVGERGPEVYTPSSSGRITPNDKLGGSQTANITFNVQAFDSQSFQVGMAQNRATILGVVREAFNRNGQAVAI